MIFLILTVIVIGMLIYMWHEELGISTKDDGNIEVSEFELEYTHFQLLRLGWLFWGYKKFLINESEETFNIIIRALERVLKIFQEEKVSKEDAEVDELLSAMVGIPSFLHLIEEDTEEKLKKEYKEVLSLYNIWAMLDIKDILKKERVEDVKTIIKAFEYSLEYLEGKLPNEFVLKVKQEPDKEILTLLLKDGLGIKPERIKNNGNTLRL